MEQHRPRHIRDIAHLYLSRQKAVVRTVTLSANSREHFSGFHAANLSVAFVRAGYSVRLFELSGLLPDSCYFLSLPSEITFSPSRQRFGPVAALDGITVFFSRVAPVPSPSGAGTIDLVHGPPESVEDSAKSTETTPVDTVLSIVEIGEDTSGKPSTRLEVVGSATEGAVTGGLGVISRWREGLRDRTPVAVRDPGSHLSRQYDTVAAGVIATWRNNGERATRPATASARIG